MKKIALILLTFVIAVTFVGCEEYLAELEEAFSSSQTDDETSYKTTVAEDSKPTVEITSEYEYAYVRVLSEYSCYYMFDKDESKVIYFVTSDTGVDEGTYSYDSDNGFTINWNLGGDSWTEQMKNTGDGTAVMIDRNGFDWEYETCSVQTAQQILNDLK